MRLSTKLSSALATLVIAGSILMAQPRSGMRPRYNTSSEAKITGTVQDVIQPRAGRGWYGTGTHLILRTDGGTMEVHLGPTNYISSQGFTFSKGDVLEILGSKATIAGKDTIIAREVTKDGKKLTLRDETGRPLWAGRGRT